MNVTNPLIFMLCTVLVVITFSICMSCENSVSCYSFYNLDIV